MKKTNTRKCSNYLSYALNFFASKLHIGSAKLNEGGGGSNQKE